MAAGDEDLSGFRSAVPHLKERVAPREPKNDEHPHPLVCYNVQYRAH